MSWWAAGNAVLALIAPRYCAGCDAEGCVLCPACRDAIEELPPPGSIPVRRSRVWAAYPYAAPVDRVLRRGKYAGSRAALVDLSLMAAARLEPMADHVVALVPVPLGRRRRDDRGYNQAEVIARVMGAQWQIPVHDGLRRTRETTPQVGTDETARARNVEGAFAWNGTAAPPRAVGLIDDVCTTGATAAAAAAALETSGCEQVYIITVARVL